MMTFDNDPNNHGDHLGSAYLDGWYGFVSKDLRRAARAARAGPLLAHLLRRRLADRLPRRAAAGALGRARARARGQLYDEDQSTPATDRVDTCPAGKSDQWCWDSVRFRPIGAVTVPHDPLDQPAHLPAGGRDPGPPPARLPAAEGRDARSGAARARLPGLLVAEPRRTARRSPSAPATRPCCARTTSRSAPRTRTARPTNSIGIVRLRRPSRQPGHADRRGRRAGRRSADRRAQRRPG